MKKKSIIVKKDKSFIEISLRERAGELTNDSLVFVDLKDLIAIGAISLSHAKRNLSVGRPVSLMSEDYASIINFTNEVKLFFKEFPEILI
jgi:hypothetical protein